MALFLAGTPQSFAPVYRPVVWTLVSDNYPVQGGLFGNVILGIAKPTAEQLSIFDGLSSDDVVVYHAPINITYYTNSRFIFTNTVGYNGTWRVLRVLSPTLMVISAPYNGDTSGGDMELTLGNYTMFAMVQAAGTSATYAVKPVYNTQSLRWELSVDVRDFLARNFKDIKELIGTSDTLITDATGYISMPYTIQFYEGWDVVDSQGRITFTKTEIDPDIAPKNIQCTNIVQPYHHVERDGTVDLDWQEGVADYIRLGIPGESTKPYLTYLPPDGKVTVRSGDAFYLAWLYNGPNRHIWSQVEFFNAAGQSLPGSINNHGNPTAQSLAYRSAILNVGPSAFSSIPAGTAYYEVKLFAAERSTVQIAETFRFTLVPCKGVNKRWYYLNKLGGVDAFTFEGDETRQMTVRRETISKPTMATVFDNHEWQTRVWRTEPQRKYTLTSGYLLPVMLRRIAEDMFESPNIFTEIRDGWWTNIIPITSEAPGDSDTARQERFVIQYQLGVDNQTQRT